MLNVPKAFDNGLGVPGNDIVKVPTGLLFDDFMAQHENPWDPEDIECPQRLLRSKARLDELGLTEKCKEIPSRRATDEEILLCHTKEYLDDLKSK